MSAAATPVETLSSSRVTEDLLRPILETTWRFWTAIITLGMIMAWAMFCWGYQIVEGLGVTGYNRTSMWGSYETNFVFWVGISHAGTLISAILRVTGASWRRPNPRDRRQRILRDACPSTFRLLVPEAASDWRCRARNRS